MAFQAISKFLYRHVADRPLWQVRSWALLITVVPLILVAFFSCTRLYHTITDAIFARRSAVVYLAATTIKEKLDRVKEVGVALATRVRFRQLVAESKWVEAVQIFKDVPENLPFIERIFLADLNGVLRSDYPALGETVGMDFSYRDWYKGVTESWQPYVSEAYRRAASPQYNVVTVAIPVNAEDGTRIGIMALQIGLGTFFEWIENVNEEVAGYIVVVDKNGRVVAHPELPAQGEIVDISHAPVVQKILAGQSGLETIYNPVEKEKQLCAYAPIPPYGWGVLAKQSSVAAFAPRREALAFMVSIYIGILVLTLILVWVILITLEKLRRFQFISGSANDANFLINESGCIEYVNRYATAVLGYSADELLDMHLELVDTNYMPEKFQEILNNPQSYKAHEETEFRKKDGSLIIVDTSVVPVHFEGKKHIFIVARDITKQRKNEETLRENEEKFRAVFETAQDAIITADTEGTIIAWNKSAERIFRFKREEIIGKALINIIPPHLREEHHKGFNRYAATGEAHIIGKTVEIVGMRKGGEQFPVELSLSTWSVGDRKFFTAIIRDISDKKKVSEIEKELYYQKAITELEKIRSAELRNEVERRQLAEAMAKRLAAIVESSEDAIIGKSLDGIITSWNKGAEKLYGYTAGEVIGRSITIIAPPARKQEITSFLETLRRGEHIQHTETIRVRKDGAFIHVSLSISPVKDEEGKVIGASSIARDITEQKKAEQELRESEARFHLMADTAPVMIWMAGGDTLFNFFNKSWLDFRGRPMEQELGNGWTQGIHPDDLEECRETYISSFKERKPFRMQYRLRRFDGEYRWILDSGVPRFTTGGIFTGYIGSCVDITERIEAEQALKKSLEIKQEFISTVSHELRTPLAISKEALSLLLREKVGEVSDKQKEIISMASSNLDRLNLIINDILDVSKIEAGRMELHREWTNIVHLLEESHKAWKLQADKKKIDFQLQGPQKEIKLYIDRSRFLQILSNLINNALNFTPPGGKVEIMLEEREKDCRFAVKDTGPGIAKEDMPRLFQRFEQLERAYGPGKHGTGLGLSIIKSLVELHGGTVGVESEKGKGTTFLFIIPKSGPQPRSKEDKV